MTERKPLARYVSLVERLERARQGFEPMPPNPERVEPGQLWLVRDVPGGLALVMHKMDTCFEAYACHPVVDLTAYLSDRDVWIVAADNPLQRNLMIQSWLHANMLRDQFLQYVGNFQPYHLDTVYRIGWQKGDPNAADLAAVGPPISGKEDPRYVFQAESLARWEVVNRQTMALYVSEVSTDD